MLQGDTESDLDTDSDVDTSVDSDRQSEKTKNLKSGVWGGALEHENGDMSPKLAILAATAIGATVLGWVKPNPPFLTTLRQTNTCLKVPLQRSRAGNNLRGEQHSLG